MSRLSPLETVVVPQAMNGERVDKILAQLLEGVTRALVQRWLQEDRITVGERLCRAKDRLAAGSVVSVIRGQELLTQAEPDAEVPFVVCYEDDALLVVDKPAGVVVHPARGHLGGTLVNGLLAHGSFSVEQLDLEEDGDAVPDALEHYRPGIVHRIDKDTSGLLVVAKTGPAREALKLQFAAHTIERSYVALTYGCPSLGRIETFYGRDPRSRIRFTSRVKEGKRAVTRLERVEKLAGGAAALVECELETGRTHQIRVHLLEQRGTPLLGDRTYRLPQPTRDARVIEIAERLGRQALHARTLGFHHPGDGRKLSFESALPPDFQSALTELASLAPVEAPPRKSRG
jgi:23S rRNA pseudouridine1911/1915/1917 synthase